MHGFKWAKPKMLNLKKHDKINNKNINNFFLKGTYMLIGAMLLFERNAWISIFLKQTNT